MITVSLITFLFVYAFYQLSGLPIFTPGTESWMPRSQDELAQTGGELVPLEAHIMSKCPDAKVGPAVQLR